MCGVMQASFFHDFFILPLNLTEEKHSFFALRVCCLFFSTTPFFKFSSSITYDSVSMDAPSFSLFFLGGFVTVLGRFQGCFWLVNFRTSCVV